MCFNVFFTMVGWFSWFSEIFSWLFMVSGCFSWFFFFFKIKPVLTLRFFLLKHQDRGFWDVLLTIICNYFRCSPTIGPAMRCLQCIAMSIGHLSILFLFRWKIPNLGHLSFFFIYWKWYVRFICIKSQKREREE